MKLLKTSAILERLQTLQAELSTIKVGLREATWDDSDVMYYVEMASILEKEIKLVKLINKLNNDGEEDC